QPTQGMRSDLRRQQALRRNDPEMLRVGLDMLAAKVANQASVLRYFARYRKRTDEAAYRSLAASAENVRGLAELLAALDSSSAGVRAAAMGYEGRAAASYWAAFGSLIPGDLAFPRRHTRHATDPVNSAVNYVYGVLYGEVWKAVIRAGLDPYFGIMHGSERDQGSLIFDLIEEFRAPAADRLVLGMIGRGFQPLLDKEGRLRSGARHKLVHAFHKQWRRPLHWRGRRRALAEVLDLQVASLRKTYLDGAEYRPFRFRW
ncbi:MAG: CRISPR-associated endonuclease Cas1, partial [Burkholderiales bacterium]